MTTAARLPATSDTRCWGFPTAERLQLYGKKGATYSKLPAANSGTSWARLNQSVKGRAPGPALVLDRAVDWEANDQIVLTTTDYLPAHSEQFTILECQHQ